MNGLQQININKYLVLKVISIIRSVYISHNNEERPRGRRYNNEPNVNKDIFDKLGQFCLVRMHFTCFAGFPKIRQKTCLFFPAYL